MKNTTEILRSLLAKEALKRNTNAVGLAVAEVTSLMTYHDLQDALIRLKSQGQIISFKSGFGSYTKEKGGKWLFNIHTSEESEADIDDVQSFCIHINDKIFDPYDTRLVKAFDFEVDEDGNIFWKGSKVTEFKKNSLRHKLILIFANTDKAIKSPEIIEKLGKPSDYRLGNLVEEVNEFLGRFITLDLGGKLIEGSKQRGAGYKSNLRIKIRS